MRKREEIFNDIVKLQYDIPTLAVFVQNDFEILSDDVITEMENRFNDVITKLHELRIECKGLMDLELSIHPTETFNDLNNILENLLGEPISQDLISKIRSEVSKLVINSNSTAPSNAIKIKVVQNSSDSSKLDIIPLNLYTGLLLNNRCDNKTYEFIQYFTTVKSLLYSTLYSYKDDVGFWRFTEWKDGSDPEFTFEAH